MKKRIISALLVLVLLLSCIPVFSGASEPSYPELPRWKAKKNPGPSAPVKELAAQIELPFRWKNTRYLYSYPWDGDPMVLPFVDMQDQTFPMGIEHARIPITTLMPEGSYNKYLHGMQIFNSKGQLVYGPVQFAQNEGINYGSFNWWLEGFPAGDYYIYTYVVHDLISEYVIVEDTICETHVSIVKNPIPLKSIKLYDWDDQPLTGWRTIDMTEDLMFYVDRNPQNATSTDRTKMIYIDNPNVVDYLHFGGFMWLIPLSPGKTTVTVYAEDGICAYFGVEVTGGVKQVTLSPSYLSLRQDDSYTLTANIKPAGTNCTYEWVSDNPEVATVDSKGCVTAVAPGTAIISCTATAYGVSATGTCTVSVPDPDDPCADYPDVNRTLWYHDAVDFVIANGLMGSTQTSALTFEPNTKVSRAMVASILYRMAGEGETLDYQGTFTDVPEGKWYTTAVEWCAKNGLASGKGNGKFDPNGNVTRQELAVFMYKLAEFRGKDVSGRADFENFADAASVPAWSKDYLAWAVDAGIISGQAKGEETYLNPTAGAMRSELASILMRFAEIPADPTEPTDPGDIILPPDDFEP